MKYILSLALCVVACGAADSEVSEPSVTEEDLISVNKKAVWHIDLENPVNLNAPADIFDIDLFDNLPSETNTIATLHAKGKKVICYFSAGTDEPTRPDHGRIPRAAIGKKMADWDEYWLDIRSEGVWSVMASRIRLAKQAGCDGVDPDNVDGYANAINFPLSAAHQLDFNRYLARTAHANGLIVGLKNDTAQIAVLEPAFDFAINEQCFKYRECDTELAFTRAGKSVLNIEYGSIAELRQVCPIANQHGFFTILSARDRLDGTFEKCSTETSGSGGINGGPDGSRCYSYTLKKAMPRSACVQAANNRRWYQCEASGWVDVTGSLDRCSSQSPLQ